MSSPSSPISSRAATPLPIQSDEPSLVCANWKDHRFTLIGAGSVAAISSISALSGGLLTNPLAWTVTAAIVALTALAYIMFQLFASRPGTEDSTPSRSSSNATTAVLDPDTAREFEGSHFRERSLSESNLQDLKNKHQLQRPHSSNSSLNLSSPPRLPLVRVPHAARTGEPASSPWAPEEMDGYELQPPLPLGSENQNGHLAPEPARPTPLNLEGEPAPHDEQQEEVRVDAHEQELAAMNVEDEAAPHDEQQEDEVRFDVEEQGLAAMVEFLEAQAQRAQNWIQGPRWESTKEAFYTGVEKSTALFHACVGSASEIVLFPRQHPKAAIALGLSSTATVMYMGHHFIQYIISSKTDSLPINHQNTTPTV